VENKSFFKRFVLLTKKQIGKNKGFFEEVLPDVAAIKKKIRATI